MSAVVTTAVRVKTDEYKENAAIRQALAAAVEILDRNPEAKASRLAATAIREKGYSTYRGKVTITFALTEAI